MLKVPVVIEQYEQSLLTTLIPALFLEALNKTLAW